MTYDQQSTSIDLKHHMPFQMNLIAGGVSQMTKLAWGEILMQIGIQLHDKGSLGLPLLQPPSNGQILGSCEVHQHSQSPGDSWWHAHHDEEKMSKEV